jgi:hypothetical protein
MCGTGIERDGGESETFASGQSLEGEAACEFADRVDEEVQVEEEEEEDEDEVYSQGGQTWKRYVSLD